ncbi:hypothetical protein NHF48_004845 [Sphingomonas sp. H160509]|uniref:hypothetical protein n=1 Tax=Sphingomonas sp. H160509 TaxID=2955313 RepID=UPI0020974869|nr:hypothetical protein [Sphingomonas sp. H160509]MDD1450476.1 hypothetical protein [Sphingomonas sp. H160509]
METFLSHIDVKQRGIVTRAMTEATRTGVIDVEYRIDAADGASRWLVAKGAGSV